MVFQDWTSLVVGSLQNLWIGAVAVLGNIVGALVVLIVGLVVASGLAALAERVLGLVKLDKALSKLGVEEYLGRAGLRLNSGKFVGKLVYWFFVVVFLLAATDILRFYSLSNFLREVLLYVPNVFVAVLIMLSAVAALSQLGVAVGLINSLVTGFVAMLALAGGIAFGLGGKEYAAHLLGKLRDRVEK